MLGRLLPLATEKETCGKTTLRMKGNKAEYQLSIWQTLLSKDSFY
jgi:hypothetical protein